ncbi:restriction endonuclease subunit S [Flavobacterium sp.]|uniref:restriction endonuclease subunit S n=1 Tax=Flavobacterium sp. TaxID=239 RepID=UPI0022BBE7D8|nr:restriction endonuclease subunit S [Flavobacterium sp.]MCZ8091197.1 restriction endonuclease subunit S [Flavobacterium sp.]
METLQPKLRFPEFKENWENRKLGQFTQWASGGTPPKDNINYWNGDIPWISASSMRGLEYTNSELKITKEGLIKGSKLAKKGDLLLLVRGSMLFNKIPIGIAGIDVSFNQDLKSISVDNKVSNSKYILHWFFYSEPKVLNMVTGTGIGAGKLDLTDLKDLNINLPSLEEQTKIANFLSSIDERIDLLKEKKSLLEDYKKGLMQKIFNQEIRFKDDNGNDFDDWEIKTLGEVADFFKGKGLPKNHIKDDGSFKCIHYGELFTKYNELIKNVISKTDIYDKPFLSIANDVLMPTSDVTPNGLATASCILEDGVILGGDVLIIRQKKKVLDGLFLSFYVAQFREKVMKLVSGSTVYHLYGSDMKNLEIFIPCLKEQNKISTFLSAIDEKIELVSNQIQDTQDYKKGLLQQMFV